MSPLITGERRSKRLWDKEFHGDEIAQKLNSAKPSPSAVRVRILIEQLQALAEKSNQLESFCREQDLMRPPGPWVFDNSPLCDYELSNRKVAALAEQIMKIADELRLLLVRYHWRPDICINPNGSLRQVIRWPQQDEESAWENATVQWLLSQLPTTPQDKASFAHFTHCERCGDWFYAGRDGAKFCRDACRIMSHVQTDEGKAARAQYMRELRKKKHELRQKRAEFRSKPYVRISTSTDTPISKNPKQRKGRT
jgi:hypothetical protein